MQKLPKQTQTVSNVVLPLQINLRPYLDEVEKTLPKEFKGTEQKCQGVSYSYRFLREPIHFSGTGKHLEYMVKGKYALKLNYCPECTHLFDKTGNCIVPRVYVSCGEGEPMRRVEVGFASTIKISPDCKLDAQTKLSHFKTPDPCEISVFKYDATDRLKKELETVLQDLEKTIDEEIETVDIKKEALKAWNLLSNQIPLAQYGFLYLHPQKVAVGPIRFEQNNAFVDLNVTLQPQIRSVPEIQPMSPFPNIQPNIEGEGFDLHLDILAQYDSLNNLLNKEFSGFAFDVKKNHVVIDSFFIHGTNNQKVLFKIHVSGKRKGILFLEGTPSFNELKQEIQFPDLEFDIKTKNALLKSAKWLFSKLITDKIREKAVFDLKPHLKAVQSTLTKQINTELQKGVFLQGKINEIKILNIYPQAGELFIRVGSKGDLLLKM